MYVSVCVCVCVCPRMNDKNSIAKKSVYIQARSAAQRRLRQMKETWWSATALRSRPSRHGLSAMASRQCIVLGTRVAYQFVRRIARHLLQIG